jgi:hypothetical protein
LHKHTTVNNEGVQQEPGGRTEQILSGDQAQQADQVILQFISFLSIKVPRQVKGYIIRIKAMLSGLIVIDLLNHLTYSTKSFGMI